VTDETANLILEHLRNLRADVASVKADLGSFKTETGQRLDRLTSEVAEVKNAVAGLAYVTATTMGEMDTRLTRLESKP
jgi:hypothetical protein